MINFQLNRGKWQCTPVHRPWRNVIKPRGYELTLNSLLEIASMSRDYALTRN